MSALGSANSSNALAGSLLHGWLYMTITRQPIALCYDTSALASLENPRRAAMLAGEALSAMDDAAQLTRLGQLDEAAN